MRPPLLANGTVRIDCRRSLRLHPALQTVEMDVFDRACALTKIDQRVALLAVVIANVTLRPPRLSHAIVEVRLGIGRVRIEHLWRDGEGRKHVGLVLRSQSDLAHQNVRLPEPEHVSLLELPRNQPRATHAELEKHITARAWKSRCAARTLAFIHNRVKPKVVVVTIETNMGSTPGQLRRMCSKCSRFRTAS
eukprot:6172004-Pleurochrysis_carterae.AAC.7